MPWQLIYTSAPRGLVSGQSGFCTVARSTDLREGLAQRLEQISSYHYLELPGAAAGAPRNPIISAYRLLDLRGAKYHVLTRIVPCGLDFTARTNHLAQHLVFQPTELESVPSPAVILRHWKGWRGSWRGEPRLLEPLALEAFKGLPVPSWPAQEWNRLTGDAGRAAGLLEGDCVRGCYLLCPPAGEMDLLNLFCETLELTNPSGQWPARAWQNSFTTFLQAEDTTTDFQWRGCQAGTPAFRQAVQRSIPIVQLRNVRVPNNALARIARVGPEAPPRPSPGEIPGTPLKLRRESSPVPIATPAQIDFSGKTFNRSRPSASTGAGWSFSVSMNSLLGLGIALTLTAAVVLAYLFVHHAPRREAKPSVPDSPRAGWKPPAGAETFPPSPPEDAVQPVRQRPRADVHQLEDELSGVLDDTKTFLFLEPELPSQGALTIEGVGPLGGLLRDLNQLRRRTSEVQAELNFDRWGAGGEKVLHLDSIVRPGGGTLLAKDAAGDTVSFDYVNDLGNGQALQLQPRFLDAPKAFSVRFRPAPEAAKAFESFRLLVVNESNNPPALTLPNHFVLGTSRNRGALAMLEEPLSRRLQWNTPMTRESQDLAWQLRPYVRTKDSSAPRDLWREVLNRWPARGDELRFSKIRKGLTQELATLTNEAATLENRLEDLAANTPSNVDMTLPLGAWLGLTNDLVSFAAFTNQAAGISPDFYLRYLRRVIAEGRRQNEWLKITDSRALPKELYDKCQVNLPPDKAQALTLSGPVTNYFLAVLQSLEDPKEQRELERQKRQKEEKIQRMRELLACVPASWDRAAFLTLNYLGPDGQPLEVIRFSDF